MSLQVQRMGYAQWKALVNAQKLFYAHVYAGAGETSGSHLFTYVFAGNENVVFSAHLTSGGADETDWIATFQSTSSGFPLPEDAMASLPFTYGLSQRQHPYLESTVTHSVVQGQCATAATTRRQLSTAAYTDQTSQAQRSVVSTSANDDGSPVGTGVRTVRLTYYDNAWVLRTEDITLNGIGAVNTVATDIRYVEDFAALTVGSLGEAAGDIKLFSAAGGGGTELARIAVAEVQALMGHHFVPSGKVCRITGFQIGNKGGVAARVQFRVFDLSATDKPDDRFDSIPVPSNDSVEVTYSVPKRIVGPARISLWVFPNTATATNYHGSFTYYEASV